MKRAPRIAVIVCSCLILVSSGAAGRPETEHPNQGQINKQLRAGKKALNAGNFAKALQAFERANALSGGDSPTAYLEIGTALWRKYQTIPHEQEDDRESTLTRAESALRRALDLTDGDLAIAWSDLSLVLEQQGSLAEAQSALEEYLNRAPNNTSARARLDQIQARLAWEAKVAQAIETGELFKGSDSGDVSRPLKISGPPPQYTEEDRKAGIEGVVLIQAIIDEQGYVADLVILKGLPGSFNDAALNAVREWRFEPATKDGIPVRYLYNLTINFKLP